MNFLDHHKRSLRAFSQGSTDMANEAIHADASEALYFAESVGLLWEGIRRVVYGGIETDHLIALCSIVAQVSERRLARLQSGPQSTESDKAIQELRSYHRSALELLAWAKTPTPEPDWSAVEEKLGSIGAAPLDFPK